MVKIFVCIYIYTHTLTFILIDVYDEDIDGDIIYKWGITKNIHQATWHDIKLDPEVKFHARRSIGEL